MTDDGRDIVAEMRAAIAFEEKNGDTNGCTMELMERAIAEIQFLRGMAGAVSQGESFGEIKRQTSVKTIAELEAILKEDKRAVTINADGTVTEI